MLGRTKFLPYEFFQHYEHLIAFLDVTFKDKPGEDRVKKRHFLIMDAKIRYMPMRYREI